MTRIEQEPTIGPPTTSSIVCPSGVERPPRHRGGNVYLSDRAFQSDEPTFDTLLYQLEAQSWQEVPVGAERDGLRTHSDGRRERFDPEDFDR